ncbi:splicing factor protein [Trichinella spiralis]|uniref:splicing factor protein n=1 Tax=Trichinella spiralis TaxID=6334 RepID=UPI0001EFED72|nr:splicing factor protein [Trichinella spiralis]
MHSSSSSFRSAFGRFRFTASFFDLALPAEAVITSLCEVVDCIRLKTRTEGNSRCTQDLKSREKPRQSQRRKIRKGRADHGPRYRSTQLPLQHLDLTIGGEVR